MTTRLEIINAMLASVGEQPVSSADSQHPSVISANEILNKIDRRVQQKGWWFNTEKALLLSKNLAGEIILPSNTLSVDPCDTASNLVQRGTKLYDRVNHTFSIGEDVYVDIIVQLPIDELTTHAADYIGAYAVYDFYVNDDGDDSKANKYDRERFDTLAALKAEHLRNSDLNAINRPAVAALVSRVRPVSGSVGRFNPTYPGGRG